MKKKEIQLQKIVQYAAIQLIKKGLAISYTKNHIKIHSNEFLHDYDAISIHAELDRVVCWNGFHNKVFNTWYSMADVKQHFSK